MVFHARLLCPAACMMQPDESHCTLRLRFIPQGSPKAASRFLLEPDYEEFDRDDPTARARVGPSPQLSGGDANYTVIYNFASPTPRRKEADKDGGYAGQSST